MITRFLTDINTKFNPFSIRAKAARCFLALLPSDARTQMNITAELLPRSSRAPATLQLKFKDGKELNLDLNRTKLKEVTEQVNRHSRLLARAEELSGN